MVKERVLIYDFKKLRLEDFPASCTYISNQKDFEKESHAVSVDGTLYINKRAEGHEAYYNVCSELAKMTRYQLDQALKAKKKSKLKQDIIFCNLVTIEKGRRNIERKYYLTK